MLTSNSKSLRNLCSAEKEGFKPGMKEWVGDDGKLIIISITVSSINVSQFLGLKPAANTETRSDYLLVTAEPHFIISKTSH